MKKYTKVKESRVTEEKFVDPDVALRQVKAMLTTNKIEWDDIGDNQLSVKTNGSKESIIKVMGFVEEAKKGEYDKENTAKITVGKDVWYFSKMGDTTHVEVVNNIDAIGIGGMNAHHIGQHKGEPYYDDLRSWLKGGKSPDGKVYK